MSEPDLAQIESELRGRTLLVYWYFIRHSDSHVGARAIQRAMKFSSPSVASHHLEKLRRLGLLKKRLGEYHLTGDVKVGLLKFFVKLGRLMLPRYLFYAVLFTAMFLTYMIIYPQTFSGHNIVALMFGGLACTILWYETLRILRETPF